MVSPFAVAATPFLRIGPGVRQELPDQILRYGSRVLLLMGEKSFPDTPFWPLLQDQLRERQIQWQSFSVSGEPSPQLIDEIVSEARSSRPQVVVGIGGGSVLDAGKAVAAMLTETEGVKHYLEGVGSLNPGGTTLSFLALPTTSGTGSEATKNAVLSEVGEQGFKKSLRHDHYIPKLALLDPELMVSAPRHITAQSGMDAFTQLLEAYLSPQASPFTDALALQGLGSVRDYLMRVVKDGEDLEARAGMAYAAYLSGICLANAGLGIVHGFASSVGGRIAVPHGLLCGSLMGVTNRLTVAKLLQKGVWVEALEKYATVGKLFFPTQPNQSVPWYAQALVDQIEAWTDQLDFASLGTFGLTMGMIPELVAATEPKNHPVALDRQEMEQILRERL